LPSRAHGLAAQTVELRRVAPTASRLVGRTHPPPPTASIKLMGGFLPRSKNCCRSDELMRQSRRVVATRRSWFSHVTNSLRACRQSVQDSRRIRT
jgi:hypothetical protein